MRIYYRLLNFKRKVFFMIKTKYIKILTLLLLLTAWNYLPADSFNEDDDQGRIVCFVQSSEQADFLVVDEVHGNTVVCHEYSKGKDAQKAGKRISKPAQKLLKLNIFEDNISIFNLTTDTLLNHHSTYKQYLLIFAKKYFADNERIKLLLEFKKAESKFYSELNKTRENNKKLKDIEDQLDELHILLNNCTLQTFITRAIDAGDWVLAVYIYDCYGKALSILQKEDRKGRSLFKDIRDYRRTAQQELLNKFRNYLDTAEFDFLNDYEKNHGKWERPRLHDFKDLKAFFQTHSAAFELYMNDTYRPLHNFSQWSDTMIRLLIVSCKLPMAEDLRKDFMREMQNFRKRQSRR